VQAWDRSRQDERCSISGRFRKRVSGNACPGFSQPMKKGRTIARHERTPGAEAHNHLPRPPRPCSHSGACAGASAPLSGGEATHRLLCRRAIGRGDQLADDAIHLREHGPQSANRRVGSSQARRRGRSPLALGRPDPGALLPTRRLGPPRGLAEQRAADEPSPAPPPPAAGPPAGSHAAWGEAARAATTLTGSRYPAHWEPGQLLNVRQFTDGSRVVCLLHEDPERAETETLTFDNASDAQEFVAWWYAPAAARDDRYQPGSPPRSGRAGFAPPRSQGAV
jgi:hypothetical protein